jgi:hypothetical protein
VVTILEVVTGSVVVVVVTAVSLLVVPVVVFSLLLLQADKQKKTAPKDNGLRKRDNIIVLVLNVKE